MECELWNRLYLLVRETAKQWRRPKAQFSDAIIVLVLLWAALHDRPITWACQSTSWAGTRLRPLQLPSDGTMSRRLETESLHLFQAALAARVRATGDPDLIRIIDGKSLTVGGCSKDPDAKWGRAAGSMGRGYKLHCIWSNHPFPDAWDVRPLNVDERRVAPELVGRVKGTGYLVGDTQYDSSPLHDFCSDHHYQLVAPGNRKATGRGHKYQSPHRRHTLEMLKRTFGRELLAARRGIERLFGNFTSFGGGLAPLPAWVRRLHRVRRWVWAKLLINSIRIQFDQQLAA
jgi:Transposase DDE domain